MWKAPPESELKYIHFPSGDHAAKVHWPVGGPICCDVELPSIGARRHRSMAPRSFISTNSMRLPSGEGYERWAMARSWGGTYRSRDPARLSSAVTIAIC